MAWTTPATAVTGDVLTAAWGNTYIRDNLLQTAPAKVTTAGDLVVATGANALKRLALGAANRALMVNAGGTDVEWGTVDGIFTYRLGYTWALPGEISVPSGDADYVVPFFVSLATGQTATLVKARHRINAGASVTCSLQKNGVDITGFTGISVTTTTADTDPADVTLADNDMLAVVVTAVSGTPKNLTMTIFIEFTQ